MKTILCPPTCLLTGGSISFLRFDQGASGGLAAGRFDGGKLDGSSRICLMVCFDLGLIMIVLNSKHSFAVWK